MTYEGLIPDVLKDVTRRTGIEFTITPLGKGKFGEAANETWSKMTDVVTNQVSVLRFSQIHACQLYTRSFIVEHRLVDVIT